MRCKACDYPLWNLRSRECPECGKPFLPSEFDYVLNSVRFCCPVCGQAYYGTGTQGHLVPREFACVSCGRPTSMDDMVLLPTEGVREEQTKPDLMPWLERRTVGLVKAWFATVGKSMVAPHRLIEATPVEAPSGLFFATLTNLLFLTVGFGAIMLLPLIMGLAMRGGGGGAAPALGIAGGFALSFLGVAVGVLIATVLWILVAHGILRLTGGAAYTLQRTAQAICYSSGANVLVAVPCIGIYSCGLWWIISATIMLAKGQRVSGGRAALATLVLPGLLVAGSVGFVMYQMSVLGTAAAAAGGTGPWTISGGAAEDPDTATEHVLGAVTEYAEGHDGEGPPHAIMFATGNPLTPGDFAVRGISESTDPTVRVLGVSLDDYNLLSDATRAEFDESAAKSMPYGVVAHRVGDFVFTYHGIDLRDAAAAELWVVVYARDPFRSAPDGFTVVGCADGTTELLGPGMIDVRLMDQNAKRVAAGLDPLPQPFGVRTDSPAVGTSTRDAPKPPGD